MILDKAEHRDFLLALIEQAQYPGKILDLVIEVKKSVANSTVTAQEQ